MDPAEAAAMEQVAEGLRLRFPDMLPEEIAQLLVKAHRYYDDRPFRHFVPLLVEREVTDTLRAFRESRHRVPAPRQESATPVDQPVGRLVDRPA